MTAVSDVGDRLRRQVDNLPVLPTVVGRLMVLDRDDQAFFDSVLKLVENDPTFAARLISAANSASSSPRTPVASVRGAIARLGSGGAASMILSLAVSRVFIPRDPWEKSLWRHAIQVGTAARSFAAVTTGIGVSGDEAYTAGLLHDVGRFVMFEQAPEALRRIDESDWDTPALLLETERSVCGMNHAELGARACHHWGLPDLLVDAVAQHHESGLDSAAGPRQALAALVQFADLAMFPSAMPGTPGFDHSPLEVIEERLVPHLPDVLSLSPEALRKIIAAGCAEADAACAALGLT